MSEAKINHVDAGVEMGGGAGWSNDLAEVTVQELGHRHSILEMRGGSCRWGQSFRTSTHRL